MIAGGSPVAFETCRDLFGLFADAPVGLVLLDTDLRYVLVNDTLAELNGVPASAHVFPVDDAGCSSALATSGVSRAEATRAVSGTNERQCRPMFCIPGLLATVPPGPVGGDRSFALCGKTRTQCGMVCSLTGGWFRVLTGGSQ